MVPIENIILTCYQVEVKSQVCQELLWNCIHVFFFVVVVPIMNPVSIYTAILC